MLNKELLMTGITGKEPHIIIYVDDYFDPDVSSFNGYGYSKYGGTGEVSRIPCWGRFGTMLNYAALSTLVMVGGLVPQTLISWRNPVSSNRLVVTRLDTGKSVEFVNTDPSTSGLYTDAPFFTRADQYTKIPLIFDPPPDYYLDPVTDKPIA